FSLNGIAAFPMLTPAASESLAALSHGPRIKTTVRSNTRRHHMSKNRSLFGFALLGLGFSAAVITAMSAPPAAGQETKANQNLVREVRHQLLLLPYYSVFDNLAFKVDGDHVTLEGQVTNPTLKHDAEAVVKGIEGVSAVTNNIEALPPSPMDDQLRHALYRAI